MLMMTMMLMIKRREVVGGRDVALLTGLWQQRDSGPDDDEDLTVKT